MTVSVSPKGLFHPQKWQYPDRFHRFALCVQNCRKCSGRWCSGTVWRWIRGSVAPPFSYFSLHGPSSPPSFLSLWRACRLSCTLCVSIGNLSFLKNQIQLILSRRIIVHRWIFYGTGSSSRASSTTVRASVSSRSTSNMSKTTAMTNNRRRVQ